MLPYEQIKVVNGMGKTLRLITRGNWSPKARDFRRYLKSQREREEFSQRRFFPDRGPSKNRPDQGTSRSRVGQRMLSFEEVKTSACHAEVQLLFVPTLGVADAAVIGCRTKNWGKGNVLMSGLRKG